MRIIADVEFYRNEGNERGDGVVVIRITEECLTVTEVTEKILRIDDLKDEGWFPAVWKMLGRRVKRFANTLSEKPEASDQDDVNIREGEDDAS